MIYKTPATSKASVNTTEMKQSLNNSKMEKFSNRNLATK